MNFATNTCYLFAFHPKKLINFYTYILDSFAFGNQPPLKIRLLECEAKRSFHFRCSSGAADKEEFMIVEKKRIQHNMAMLEIAVKYSTLNIDFQLRATWISM